MNWFFGAHSLMELRYRGEGLGLASSDVTDFTDSPWEASLTLRTDEK